jgi:anti-sigma B factor antagonist
MHCANPKINVTHAWRQCYVAFDVFIEDTLAKVVLSGDIDLQTTPDLKSTIMALTKITSIEIDTSSVNYIDSSGIAVLLMVHQHCQKSKIDLSFSRISVPVLRVLQIAKLDSILPITSAPNEIEMGKIQITSDDITVDLLSDDKN